MIQTSLRNLNQYTICHRGLFLFVIVKDLYFFTLPLPYRLKHSTRVTLFAHNFLLTQFLSSITLSYAKFSFSGKGYRMYISNNTVAFTLGHSHLYYIYNRSAAVSLTSKTKGYLLGIGNYLLSTRMVDLFNTKPLNIFTWRGIKKQHSLKKKKMGKVSLYI